MPLDDALQATLSRAWLLPEETLPLQEASGRFLARDLFATGDNPRFDNSSVDGYAVQVADTEGARPEKMRPLRILGTVAAGEPWIGVLPSGCALKIMTGAPLPAGADAVAMLEDVRVEGADVMLSRPSIAGEHVRRKGEEFRAGDLLLPAGTPVTAPVVALLASLGLSHATVRRRPRVAVITTGTEVVSPGEKLGPGQIYDANREGLLAALGALGIRPVVTHRCPDDLDSLRGRLREAFQGAEVVITAGGVSVGDFDHVREAAQSAGLKPVFWKIALKPGKPNFFGTFPRTDGPDGVFFGLPGNPVGALLSFRQLVRPVLERMMGASLVHGQKLRARVNAPLRKPPGRMELVRGLLFSKDGELEVEPITARESHMVLGLARADCILYVPADVECVERGSYVTVEVLRWT
jgi:molybdopterin molybdotransferase